MGNCLGPNSRVEGSENYHGLRSNLGIKRGTLLGFMGIIREPQPQKKGNKGLLRVQEYEAPAVRSLRSSYRMRQVGQCLSTGSRHRPLRKKAKP